MIFNQGQFLGEELTDDQLRQIAASRAKATGQAAAAAESAGAIKAAVQQAAQESAMDVASYKSGVVASMAPAARPWYQGKGIWIAGGAGALLLFLALRKPGRKSALHSRPRTKSRKS